VCLAKPLEHSACLSFITFTFFELFSTIAIASLSLAGLLARTSLSAFALYAIERTKIARTFVMEMGPTSGVDDDQQSGLKIESQMRSKDLFHDISDELRSHSIYGCVCVCVCEFSGLFIDPTSTANQPKANKQ